MRLSDYFLGEEVRLRSPLAAKDLAGRVNRAAGFAFSPFRTGVVGYIWWGHVRLRYRSSFAEYNAKPILAGRVFDSPRGSELRLRYRAPAWVYIFFPLWYFVLLSLGVGISIGGFDPDVANGAKAAFAATLVAFLFVPLLFHAFGTRNSEEELAALVEFLVEHAEARP